MIFWSLSAFILFKNIEKMLLQVTSGFLQLESLLRSLQPNQIYGNLVTNVPKS
jgi:hypothetical protein